MRTGLIDTEGVIHRSHTAYVAVCTPAQDAPAEEGEGPEVEGWGEYYLSPAYLPHRCPKCFEGHTEHLTPVEEAGLPAQMVNAARKAGCETLGDVARYSLLAWLKVPNIGRATIKEVSDILRGAWLSWGYLDTVPTPLPGHAAKNVATVAVVQRRLWLLARSRFHGDMTEEARYRLARAAELLTNWTPDMEG